MANQLFRKKSINTILRDAEQGLSDAEGHAAHLKRVLRVKDLTAMGIAAVIGAGIFSSIGKASYDGGPGVVFLYIFTAIACGFAALCYAEFASPFPSPAAPIPIRMLPSVKYLHGSLAGIS